MPSVYASGKARQSLPRTLRWSLTMLFSSPPRYWAGVCTRGKIRMTASLREVVRMACTDDANLLLAVREYDYEQAPSLRLSQRHITILFVGMQRVVDRQGQRIAENGHGFIKRNAMFLDIAFRFVTVPFEFQAHR